MTKKILITGGSGFIGRAVREELDKKEFEILTVGRNQNEDIRIELTDTGLKKIVNDFSPEIICHFASGSSIAKANENKEKESQDTIVATANLLKSLKDLKPKIIYLSSQAVYGFTNKLPIKEIDKVNPNTIYGHNKLEVENLIQESNLNFVIFRVSSVFGPGQDFSKSGVIAKFIDKLTRNQPPIVFNSFNLFSDFIFIKDIVSAITQITKTNSPEKEIYNLASGKPVTLKEVLDILYKYFPNAPEPLLELNDLYPDEKQRGIYLDISKIQQNLDWSCKYNVESGLKEMLKDKHHEVLCKKNN